MNVSTVLDALRTAIAADSTWSALTGNSGVILESPINGTPSLPFASWSVPGSKQLLDLEGADRLRLDVKCYALTRSACRAMVDCLTSRWTIPSGRASQVTSGNYAIKNIRRLNSHEVPGIVRLDTGGAAVYVNVLELQLFFTKAV